MTPVAAAGRSPSDVIAAILLARTGQQICSNRAWRIDAALKPLLRAEGCASLDQLAARLTGGGEPSLATAVVEALLNQETSFFRDAGVIDMAAEFALERHAAGRRSRIWSVGCSTGQEPLSLAMLLADRADRSFAAPEVLATDVSANAIARARQARYSQFEIQRGLPIRRMIEWFEADGDAWRAKPELVARVAYRVHNLVGDPPPPGGFDLILCRNVLFYFAEPVRRAALDTLARALRPGGAIVLGAGETVIGQTELLAPSPRWRGLYQPNDAAKPAQAAVG